MTPQLRSRRGHRRGMTLIEVVVAISILLVMSLIVMESLSNSIEFNNLLSRRDMTIRTARVTLSRIKNDLELSYLTFNKTAVATYQTVFVGIDEDPDRIFFASLSHQRRYLDTRESDQTEITLWAEQSPEDIGRGFVLYRRESPRIDQYPDEQGVVLPLAYNVRTFRLRYLDQADGEWKEEWDSRTADTPYRLPRAIEIGLVLISDSVEEEGETEDIPFLSTVVLAYAPRMPNATNALLAAGVTTAATQGAIAGTFNPYMYDKGGFGGLGASGLGSGGPQAGTGTGSAGAGFSRPTSGAGGRKAVHDDGTPFSDSAYKPAAFGPTPPGVNPTQWMLQNQQGRR